MEAIKEILHVSNNKLQITLPPHFNETDVEVIIFPTEENQLSKQSTFCPSDFFGITSAPDSKVEADLKKLRAEWDRNI